MHCIILYAAIVSFDQCLRCGGSVYHSQIDKIYILLKIILKKVNVEQYYLGVGQVCKRGAKGVLEANIIVANNR